MPGLQLPSKSSHILRVRDFLIVKLRGAALSGMSTEVTRTTVTSISATRHYGTEVFGRYDVIQDHGRPFHVALDDDLVTEKVSTSVTTYLLR